MHQQLERPGSPGGEQERQGSAEQCTQKARPHAAISAQFASNGGSGSEQLGVLCCVGTVGVALPLAWPLYMIPTPPVPAATLTTAPPSAGKASIHSPYVRCLTSFPLPPLRDAQAVEAGAGVGNQVLRGGGRGGGPRRAGAVQAAAVGALAPARVLQAALVAGQQPGVGWHHRGGGQGRQRQAAAGRGDGGPAAAALVRPRRAPRRHARLLQQLPPRRGRLRRRLQGLRRRRHAPWPLLPARRRQAAQRRRLPGPPRVARRGHLPRPVPPPPPRPPPRLLLRGRGAPPRLRVHAARQPREPPLQEDLGDAAMGHPSEGGDRRRQGPSVPARRRHAGDLPRLQGVQHPPRLRLHGEALRLRAGQDGSRGRGHARDDAGDGHARVRGARVRADGPPQREERRVQLRRRAPGAPHGPPRHGARPGPRRARRPAGEARRLDAPLPQRRQPQAALHHGPEARRALLRQGRARRRAARRAVHGDAAEGQAQDGGRRRGAGEAAGAQGHGRHRRALARRRACRWQERHLGEDPRRGQGRRRRWVAAEERVLQAAVVIDASDRSSIGSAAAGHRPACHVV